MKRRRHRAVASTLALLESLSLPIAAQETADAGAPSPKYLEEVAPHTARNSPATRNAALSPGACRAELRRRHLGTRNARVPTPGVALPLRLSSPLDGVRFVVPGGKSPYGVLDCRLLLTLHDLTKILKRHSVVEVRIDNFYRPRAHLPGRKKPSQHALGLAADIVSFTLDNGRSLLVERDWRGALGGAPCGPGSEPQEPTEETVALRNLVCDIARAGIFHHLLTPNFDAAHESHLHADIKRGDRYGGVR